MTRRLIRCPEVQDADGDRWHSGNAVVESDGARDVGPGVQSLCYAHHRLVTPQTLCRQRWCVREFVSMM